MVSAIGISMTSIAVAGTAHAAGVASACSDTQFINQVFMDLLERPAQPTDVDFFAPGGTLADTRQNIAYDLLTSPERRIDVIGGNPHFVESIYQKLLGRTPSNAEVAPFLAFIQNGGTIEQVMSFVFGSSEYAGRASLLTGQASGNQAFIQQLYQDALNRKPDPQAIAFYGNYLAQGGTAQQVAVEVLDSGEYRDALINGFYQSFLHRQPDAAGLIFFATALSNGATDDALIALLMGSPEYCTQIAPVIPPTSTAFVMPTNIMLDPSTDTRIAPANPPTFPSIDPNLPLFPDIDVLIGKIAPLQDQVARLNSKLTEETADIASLVRSLFGVAPNLDVAMEARDGAAAEIAIVAAMPGANTTLLGIARVFQQRGMILLASGDYERATDAFGHAYRMAQNASPQARMSKG